MQFLLINAFDCLAVSIFFYLILNFHPCFHHKFRDRRRRRGLPYPPGPPPWPITGNYFDVPRDTPWSAYADTSKKYGRRSIRGPPVLARLIPVFPGDVICLRVYSQVVVVLCSLSAVKDLLEKRGNIYSDRRIMRITEMYVVTSCRAPCSRYSISRMELDWPLSTIRMNETWRKGRKLLDHSLRPGAMTSYWPMIQEKTREFLGRLRANPKDFRAHIVLSVGTCSLYCMTVDSPAAFREDLSCHSRMATT
jgi:hypothetical protein